MQLLERVAALVLSAGMLVSPAVAAEGVAPPNAVQAELRTTSHHGEDNQIGESGGGDEGDRGQDGQNGQQGSCPVVDGVPYPCQPN